MKKVSIPVFEPIYPEWIVDREAHKMEKFTGRKRTRAGVLNLMKDFGEKPLSTCLDCRKTCIQRQVKGLLKFKCFEKEKP